VIEAFHQAFAAGAGASLVIKCINRGTKDEEHFRMQAAASQHPDVHIIDEYVSPANKNAMIATCDCYVSLHRAEGFGLPSAEAMYFGKPVIATNYSGNLDYMTSDNSYLVDYTMTDVGDGAWPYPPNGVWAEPDVEHAASQMRHVFEDRGASSALGARAAEDIRRTHSPEVAGTTMQRRLEHLAIRARERAAAAPPSQTNPASRADVVSHGPAGIAGSVSRFSLSALLRRLVLRLIQPYTRYQRQISEQRRKVEHGLTYANAVMLAAERSTRLTARQATVGSATGKDSPPAD